MTEKVIEYNDLTAYQLGIVWAIGSYVDNRVVFRHQDRYFLAQLPISNNIYKQKINRRGKTEEQYVLKTAKYNLESFAANDWQPRNAQQRDVPILPNDQYPDFLRAYLEIHSSLDYKIDNTTKIPCRRLRLRIYGNYIMLQSINYLLQKLANTAPKKLQPAPNNITKVLYYQSAEEITNIFSMVAGEPCNTRLWHDIYAKLQNPKIRVR